jgi:glutamate/tyrosine decarboxylase-like PLP-dependent enzyme
MTFPRDFDELLSTVVLSNRDWESQWPAVRLDATLRLDADALRPHLLELAARLRDNYPYFHPLYAGQMLKPPHPAAVLGYLAAMLVNPNNHALDGGRATAVLEKEAVADLARMLGYSGDRFLGHLTASGTIANLEALWIARELHPDAPIVFSRDAHYTHKRMCDLLRAPYIELPATPQGRMDLDALDALLARGRVGTVVVTMGTTGVGALDPLPEVLDRRARHGFRVHADMAYGGYYRLLAGTDPALAPFQATGGADSIVIDPHKHGLQPYGCGCVLFADSAVASKYAHASPYTYFSSPQHHPGETTLECSRAGAAAAALWLTQRHMPLAPGGAMAVLLGRCLQGARSLEARLRRSDRYALLYETRPQAPLDIVTYFPRAASASAISAASDAVFARAEAAREPVYLAKLTVDAARFGALHPDVVLDAPRVTILRSCLMRPEQADWAETIADRLEALA